MGRTGVRSRDASVLRQRKRDGLGLAPRATGKMQRKSLASRIYASRCASCHRQDMKGAPPEYPAVDNLPGRMSATQITTILTKGSGRMPAFDSLGDPAIEVLTDFLLHKGDREAVVQRGQQYDN